MFRLARKKEVTFEPPPPPEPEKGAVSEVPALQKCFQEGSKTAKDGPEMVGI